MLIAALGWTAVAAPQDDDAGPDRWQREASRIEAELIDGRYRRALRDSRNALEALVDDGPATGEAELVGRLAMLRALAEAGQGLNDTWRWTWAAAQSVDPRLADRVPGRFGEAGRQLAGEPLRAAADDGDVAAAEGEPRRNLFAMPADVDFRLPDEDNVPAPEYPASLAGSGVGGTVMVQVLVDDRGRTRSPLVLDSPHPLLAWAATEALRDWRYRPAEIDGRRVAVYYNVRHDFRAE